MSDHTLPPIDLRQLRALRAVARMGSFHGAAEHLGYTQSAISQQIKALERHVGEQLLDRPGTRMPAMPTRAGWVVLRHAEAIFTQLEELGHELAQLNRGVAGSVRVGFFQSVGATLLPRIVRLVARHMPDVELVLIEAECDDSLQPKVAIGDLDMAFVGNPLSEDVLVASPLFEDPTVVLLRDDDPLSRSSAIAISALQERRIATFTASAHQRFVDSFLQSASGSAITVRSNDNATLAGIVSSGSAVAVMSQLSVADACREGLIAVEAVGLPSRTIGVVRHRDRPLDPAATAVFNMIVSECAGRSVHDVVPPSRPALRLLTRQQRRAAGE